MLSCKNHNFTGEGYLLGIFFLIIKTIYIKYTFKVALQYFFNVVILFNTVFNL